MLSSPVLLVRHQTPLLLKACITQSEVKQLRNVFVEAAAVPTRSTVPPPEGGGGGSAIALRQQFDNFQTITAPDIGPPAHVEEAFEVDGDESDDFDDDSDFS